MCVIFRKIRSICKIRSPVIGVQIDHHSAWLQHTEPFLISMLCIRKCPGKISGYDHIEFLIFKIRILRIHHCKLTDCFFFSCQLLCVGDHIRCQVDSGYVVALFCKKNRKKSGSASHIQDPKLPFLRQMFLKLCHPSSCQRTVKLCPSLLQEAVTSFRPVFRNPCFSLIFFADNISVGYNRSAFHDLKTGHLIQDHTIHVCTADFLHISLIITDLTQVFVSLDNIARLFHRIPEAVNAGTLVTHIIHLQRIVRAVGTDSVVCSDTAQDIPHIAAHGIYLFSLPGSHTASFQKNCRNITGTCRIIVGASCAYI